MATGSETLDIIIRSRGGRAAAADAMAVANAYRALGAESVTVQHGISDSNKEISRSGSLMAVTARTVAALTAGLGAMAAARAGINYNAEMQTNTVAFRHFLGSTQAANAELAQLVKLGMQMPQIGSAAFVAGGRRLLAFGADANKITPWLSGLGEAMSGLGLGAEGIDRATLAIGQMLSTGFIQGDEINQLVEAGINARKYLINAGVVPAAKAGQIGDLHIPSAQALDVIMQGIQDEFHGLAAESRSTWAYQVAQAKNYAVQAAAAFIKPFQDWLSSGVLDSVSERLRAIAGWLSSGGADKLWTGLALAVQAFGPAIALLTAYLAAYRTAVLAVTAAQWAWNLAMNANPVGLIITGIGLLIGVIILLVNHWGQVKAALVSVFEWVMAHPWAAVFIGPLGALIVVAGGVIKYWNQIKETVVSVWETIRPILMTMFNVLKKIIEWSPVGVIAKAKKLGIGIPGIPFMAGGGTIPVGGAAIVGEAGAELARNRGGKTEITPLGGGAAPAPRVLQPVQFAVDGRVFAEAMFDVGQTAAARA